MNNYNISKTMASYLEDKISNPQAKTNKSTVIALIKRNLCTDDGMLTASGKSVAISLLPLKEQCSIMGISIQEIFLSQYPSPEEALVLSLRKESKLAYYTENTFGVHVAPFFIFDKIYKLAVDLNAPLYGVSFGIDSLSHKTIMQVLKDNIESILNEIDANTSQRNFELITFLNRRRKILLERSASHERFGGFWQDCWERDFYRDIFTYLGVEKIKKIIRLVISNPNLYSKGWPDIIVLDREFPYFVEVKTTDKLHLSQIITMGEIINKIEIPIYCVRIKTIKKGN